MQRSATISVALWGAGEHAQRNLLPALARCPGIDLRGLYTLVPDDAARLAATYGIRNYATPAEMLADADVQAVYVSTWTSAHAACGQDVLAAGKHLWCDKPLAASWPEWQALIQQARARNLAAFEGMMFPFHAQFQALQRHLASGTIGAVRSIIARFGFPHLPAANFRTQRARGGGALRDAAVYPLTAARLLLGPVRDVHAHIETEPGFDVDTGGSALLRSSAGVHGLIEWGFGRAYRNEIEVWGERGVIAVDRAFSKPADLETSLRLRLQTGETLQEIIPPCNHFSAMLEAFARAVQAGDLEPYRQAAWEQGELLSHIGLS